MSARGFVLACVAALAPCPSARASALEPALFSARANVWEPALVAPFAWPAQGGKASFAIPANDGWVTDLAHLLTPAEERELEAGLESFKRASGHDIALLTVPDLGGRTIEEYALAIGRGWKLGDPERKDGAVLVVAKQERKLRIEVGEGLEGTLTDARAAQIIRNTITPEFKAGRFGAGLRSGIAEMQAAALGRAASDTSGSSPAHTAPLVRVPAQIWGTLCPVLMFAFMALVIGLNARRGIGRRRGGLGGFGSFLAGGLAGMSTRSSSGGGGGGFSGFGGGGRFGGGGSSGGW